MIKGPPDRCPPASAPWLHRSLLLGVGAIALIVLFWQVGSVGLVDETEPLFVEAARQMQVRADWITPYFNGVPRFDKPPLIYWLMAIAYKLFGVSEASARLPSGLAALGVMGFVAYVVAGRSPLRAWWQPTFTAAQFTGLLAAVLWLLNPNTFFWGRTAYSDMLLTATVTGALLAFFCGYALGGDASSATTSHAPSASPVSSRDAIHPSLLIAETQNAETQNAETQKQQTRKQQTWYWTFYGFLTLAVLTKGPIGVILPGLAIALFLIYVGQAKSVLKEMFLLPGLLVVAGLSLPWYIAVYIANGEAFIDSFFGYHNVERFTRVVNSHAGPWWFHLAVILVGFLPWSMVLPVAIAQLKPWQVQVWRQCSRAQQLAPFALAWFVAVLGFFTLATTKYFSYTLPLMPAAAILVAIAWGAVFSQPLTKRSGWYGAGLVQIALYIALAIGFYQVPRWLGNDPWMPNLGGAIAAAGVPVLLNFYFTLGAGAIAFALWNRSHRQWLLSHIAIFLSFWLVVIHVVLPVIDTERQLPLRQVAAAAVWAQRPQEPLVMVGFKKPSLAFYSRRHVEYLEHPEDAQALLQSGKAPSLLVVGGQKALQQTGLTPKAKLGQFGVYSLVRF